MNSSAKLTITGQYRLGDIRHNFADLTNIKNSLGFSPKVDVMEGLSRFVEWSYGQEVKCDKYDDSLKELRERGLLK